MYRDVKSEYELNAFYKQLKCLFDILNFEVEEIEYKANNKAEFHKTLLLEEIEDTISNISEADWELLYTSTGEFYASDNPVVITHREDMPVTYCDAINFLKRYIILLIQVYFYTLQQNPLLLPKNFLYIFVKKKNY